MSSKKVVICAAALRCVAHFGSGDGNSSGRAMDPGAIVNWALFFIPPFVELLQ